RRGGERVLRATPEPTRYHALDAVRGAMMLLGVYLHAMVAYSDRGSWPWKDGTTTGIFDISLGLIHLFRMPMFYVMAGFFSALLLQRRGGARLVPHQTVRILVPLVPRAALPVPLP